MPEKDEQKTREERRVQTRKWSDVHLQTAEQALRRAKALAEAAEYQRELMKTDLELARLRQEHFRAQVKREKIGIEEHNQKLDEILEAINGLTTAVADVGSVLDLLSVDQTGRLSVRTD
jgi:hypothetical protein